MFSLGLDDKDPKWGDAELSHLVVPEADYASDSEEEEEEKQQRGGGGEQPICRILWFLILTALDSEEEEGEEEEEEEEELFRISSISCRLPSMTRHGKDPGDRRRSVS